VKRVGDTGPGRDAPTTTGGSTSQWTFNWSGLVTVVLIALLVVVLWRWLPGSGVDSLTGDRSNEPAPAPTTAPAVGADGTVPTTVGPTTTLVRPTVPDSPTTTVALERQVQISGEMKPCRFGDNCLVASFAIAGFAEHPGRYVCVFPNSRYDFSFKGDQVEDACMTAQSSDTIAIEVAGVLSATISDGNLDGT
jgi:hypothetical protein